MLFVRLKQTRGCSPTNRNSIIIKGAEGICKEKSVKKVRRKGYGLL